MSVLEIRVVGVAATLVALLFVGYLLFDKQPALATFIILMGFLLVIIFLFSEIYFKKKMVDHVYY